MDAGMREYEPVDGDQEAEIQLESQCEGDDVKKHGVIVEQTLEEYGRSALGQDCLVWKFCAYGFFKNLQALNLFLLTLTLRLIVGVQLFDSFLWAVLLSWGHSLVEIGILAAIIEGMTYILEVPSGILADNCGKKRQLLLCFCFYICSFVAYANGKDSFGMLVLASVLYGLGEAFRSGTHKAMILQYLEREGLLEHKAWVYGRTRSFSQLGSALSALLGTVCVVFSPDLIAIFWFSVIPFVLDFLLVASYPSFMNDVDSDAEAAASSCADRIIYKPLQNLWVVLRNTRKRRAIVSASVGTALFKSVKHFIQPIVLIHLAQQPGSEGHSRDQNASENLNDAAAVTLGVLYTVFFMFSSLASRYSYLVLERCQGVEKTALDLTLMVFALGCAAIGTLLVLGVPLAAACMFVAIYGIHNIRKPIASIMVAELDGKKQRATLMSVESLLEALIASGIAPVAGFLAEEFSIQTLFLCVTGATVAVGLWLWGETGETVNADAVATGEPDESDSAKLATTDA